KPMTGWMKLNVSGVISSGCGGVLIRDSSGKWLCGFAQMLKPNLEADEIEKEAILKGLQWAMGRSGVTKF
ncbi:hypothetical protein A2U01_0079932, partial [Trifolium medium]|nr:hypothetical protein [Trifolium medium]